MGKLSCWLFGHKYRVQIWFDRNNQKLECPRCKKEFAINHDVRTLLPWDYELESLHREIHPKSFK
jgi:uncharacterized protein YbaR (Trm112 family)